MIINVHVTPGDEVAAQCVNISQSLKSDGTMFVLDGQSKFAHMTVFMFRVVNDRMPEVIEAVKKVLEGVEGFQCEHAGYFMTKGRYFEASYKKSVEFVAFHEKLIGALKDYRINPGDPFEEAYFTPYTDQQQANAKETGYDLAHDLFRPHITLTRYYEGKVPAINPETPSTNLSFPLQKIGVYEADDNGAVFKELAKFSVS